jgi:hypothetical protein
VFAGSLALTSHLGQRLQAAVLTGLGTGHEWCRSEDECVCVIIEHAHTCVGRARCRSKDEGMQTTHTHTLAHTHTHHNVTCMSGTNAAQQGPQKLGIQ